MKFHLFGGSDCPDSVLAQLSVVSGLSLDLVRALVEHCAQVFGASADNAAAGDTRRFQDTIGATSALFVSLSQHGHIPHMEVAQALVALHTLMANAVRFDVPKELAADELSMLGLDPSVATAVAASADAHAETIRDALKRQMPQCNGVRRSGAVMVERTVVTSADGTTATLAAEEDADTLPPLVRLTLGTSDDRVVGTSRVEVLDFSIDKAKALLVELTRARESLRDQNRVAL